MSKLNKAAVSGKNIAISQTELGCIPVSRILNDKLRKAMIKCFPLEYTTDYDASNPESNKLNHLNRFFLNQEKNDKLPNFDRLVHMAPSFGFPQKLA